MLCSCQINLLRSGALSLSKVGNIWLFPGYIRERKYVLCAFQNPSNCLLPLHLWILSHNHQFLAPRPGFPSSEKASVSLNPFLLNIVGTLWTSLCVLMGLGFQKLKSGVLLSSLCWAILYLLLEGSRHSEVCCQCCP